MPATPKNDYLTYFDDELIEKAKNDFRHRRVVSITWADDETLTGRVSSSKTLHTSTVHLKKDKSQVCCTECSCGDGFDCRHAASVLVTFLEDPASVKPCSGPPKSPHDSGLSSYRSPHKPSADTKTLDSIMDLAPTASIFRDFMSVMQGLAPQPNTTGNKPVPAELLNADKALVSSLTLFARAMQQQSDTPDLGRLQPSSKTRTSIIYVVDPEATSPSLDVFEVSVKKDGSRAVLREIDLDDHSNTIFSREDKAIIPFWQTIVYWGLDRPTTSTAGYADDFASCFKILMTRVLLSGRCCLGTIDGPSLKLGPELEGKLTWRSAGECKSLRIVAQDKEKNLDCLAWDLPWYLDSEANIIGPVKLEIPQGAARALKYLRPVTKNEIIAVAGVLADHGLSELIPQLIEGQNIELRTNKIKPRLVESILSTERAERDPNHDSEKRTQRALQLSFPPGRITDKAYITPSGKTIIERRDKSADSRHLEEIQKLCFENITERVVRGAGDDHFFVPHQPASFANLDAQTIQRLRTSGLDISKETEDLLRPIYLTEQDIRIEIKDERNCWSSMEMHIDVQGKKIALLPILRSALERLSNISSESVEALNHNGKFFASLENGNLITMPFERIKTILLALQELLDKDTESLRVSTLHAAQLLNELGAARWYGAEKLLALISQLKQLRSPKAIAPPKSFNAELRPYQLEGLAWLQLLARFNLGGILADDMGLGKTIQILAHIALEKEAGRLSFPFLVVCPTSVLPNWLAELEKFAPNLTFISHAGQNRSKSALLTTGLKADVVLTTYPILTRDLDILKQIGFHGLALDEAQTIKNPLAKVAQSAKAIKAGHRFCLTGTPVENHLGELWSEFDFLMPGVLGDKSSFNKHIRIPIEKSGNRERQEALASRIKPFLLRRTKKEVLSELPDKTVIIKQIEMTGQQLDLYETVRLACTEHIQLEIAKKGFNQSQIIILDAMLKLRQVCCDPRLVNLPTAKKVQESAKLETLLEMVEQLAAEGKKMLIFSQFTSMLDLIASELQHKEIGYVELRGDTKDRVAPVKQFQESTVPVFLLSLKSGGVGLNLTAADTVIHYDPWWNPAAEDQATDRAYRIGQSKDVFVYKLIAHGTIEQWMLSMQERKRNLASSIYDKSGNFGAAFTEDDLANLLRPMERI